MSAVAGELYLVRMCSLGSLMPLLWLKMAAAEKLL